MRFGAAALASLLVAVVATGCSGGDKKDETAAPAVQAQGREDKRKALTVGKVTIESVGPEVKLAKATRKKLLATAQSYLDAAVYEPLTSGEVGKKYDSIFAAGVRDTATGPDMNALTDKSLGKASKYAETVKPVNVFGLADGAGTLLFLATKVSMNVKATVGDGAVRIARDVEFTYEKIGDEWLVTAYRVRTVRKAPKSGTTTTTAERGEKNP